MKLYTLPLLPVCLLLSGCQTPQSSSLVSPQVTPAADGAAPGVRDIYAGQPEVVRYDRYTLVSTAPGAAQRDLLNQMTDIRMPADTVSTLGDALRYTLIESGFSLCPATGPLPVLYNRPLPSVQRHLGPVRLADALQLLAGPAWQIQVDQVMRQVCFTLRSGFKAPSVISAPTSVSVPLPPVSPSPATSPSPTVARLTDLSHIDVAPSTTLLPDWSPQGRGKATLPVVLRRILPAGWQGTLRNGVNTSTGASPHIYNWQGDRDWRLVLDDLARDNHWRISLNPDTRTILISPDASATPVATSTVPVPSTTTAVAPSTTVVKKTAAIPVPVWTAEPGTTLRTFLTRSAGAVNCAWGGKWTVVWPENVDYPISARLQFHGTFEEMVGRLFALYTPDRINTPLYSQASRSQCAVIVSDKPFKTGDR